MASDTDIQAPPEPASSSWLGRGVLRLALAAALAYVGYLVIDPDLPTIASTSASKAQRAAQPMAAAALTATPVEMAALVPAPEPPPVKLDPPALRRDELTEMQAWLKVLGFDPGAIDGMPGPATTAAIKQYQAARRQEETGAADRYLLQLIRREVGHAGR